VVDTDLTPCNSSFKMKLVNGIYGTVLPDELMWSITHQLEGECNMVALSPTKAWCVCAGEGKPDATEVASLNQVMMAGVACTYHQISLGEAEPQVRLFTINITSPDCVDPFPLHIPLHSCPCPVRYHQFHSIQVPPIDSTLNSTSGIVPDHDAMSLMTQNQYVYSCISHLLVSYPPLHLSPITYSLHL
jgi:hypothetical protein